MSRFIRDNSLTIVLLLAFLIALGGQFLSGWLVENQDLSAHGRAGMRLFDYIISGPSLSAVFENWESEFLQMAVYVVLTAILFQRGSAESRSPDEGEREGDDLEKAAHDPNAPWPARAGPLVRALYARSLGIVLGSLFACSFVLHWLFSAQAAAEEARLHQLPVASVWQYLTDAQLWFESFQNWQSEFLSTAALAILTIVLRQRGSPESKPVAASTATTGG